MRKSVSAGSSPLSLGGVSSKCSRRSLSTDQSVISVQVAGTLITKWRTAQALGLRGYSL
ncbi:unannotated protein [freshwater metagenome]|uniref:Unannotated protein n=1 Tax=freshwater metagenome TaxID=449393 RepID=A0A6J6QAY0_9ZZZZ